MPECLQERRGFHFPMSFFFFFLIVAGFVWLEFSPHLVVCTRAACSQLQSGLLLSLTVLVAGSCSSLEHSLHHKGLSWKGRTYII